MHNPILATSLYIADTLAFDSITLNESFIRNNHIPKAQHLSLRFGSFKQIVKVIPSPKRKGIQLNPKLASSLGLPTRSDQPYQVRVQYDKFENALIIGPLLAVLINRDYPDNMEKPFGLISLFCKELSEACQKEGTTVYFFTPEAIMAKMYSIQGWFFDGQWKKRVFPLPDVIYNRLPTRSAENQQRVQTLIHDIAPRYQIQFFNERFVDKNEVFDVLRGSDTVAQYLPESFLLHSLDVLKYMCNKYRVVYVKPINGSLGRGILRITNYSNQFILERTTASKDLSQKYPNHLKLYRAMKKRLLKQKYQIQQGLSLIQIGKNPVDFRALVQKNNEGNWSITSIVARTAGDEQFVSNLARGGTLSTAQEALSRSNLATYYDSKKIILELRKAAIDIAIAIDQKIPAHFGEFGVDLAVDLEGKVWLIEVNSKPSKNDRTPLQDNKIRPSVRKLISYTNYLSRFEEGRNPNAQSKTRHSRRSH